jgi:o-succinylbenzoate synthase
LRISRRLPYRLPLSRPWVAATATLAERRGCLIELTAGDGLTGWGDCAVLPSANGVGRAQMRWAIETARFDIEARRRGVPLARLLGATSLSVPVNASLGPLDEGCAARAGEVLAQGFSIGKIKVGIDAIDAELVRLRELVDVTGGRLRLRLDANGAWNEGDAGRFLAGLADLPVEALEEPLAMPTLEGLARLQSAAPFDIAVDESLARLGAGALFASRAVRRLVLKPARIGGVSRTLTLARRAQAAGMTIVITSVVDSAIGVAAAAHLAAALPGPAHGLATGEWLAVDVAPPLPVVDGHLRLPDAPGLGIAPAS